MVKEGVKKRDNFFYLYGRKTNDRQVVTMLKIGCFNNSRN